MMVNSRHLPMFIIDIKKMQICAFVSKIDKILFMYLLFTKPQAKVMTKIFKIQSKLKVWGCKWNVVLKYLHVENLMPLIVPLSVKIRIDNWFNRTKFSFLTAIGRKSENKKLTDHKYFWSLLKQVIKQITNV